MKWDIMDEMVARKTIAANWKEHPRTAAEAWRLFDATMRLAAKVLRDDVIVCPPAIYLQGAGARMAEAKRKKALPPNFALGAQDVFWEDEGAFTGGMGPKMLRVLGVRYAIIGHSERRRWFGETDEMVNKKVLAALAGGLVPIMCIGEPPEVRKKGIAAAKRYLVRQLAYGLKGVPKGRMGRGLVIVAYEPVWAIGSGKNDNPADAAAIARFIKTEAGVVKVIYGGSVNGADVRGYVQSEDINGALVGGASLKAEDFKKIINHS